ncbi:hypothetical protein CP975_00950 [Streptomyces alboniger]|uniref:Uncharacterized protein n=1 Tax=Streptomyces alboniger TaxID=132473 RepID=A0A5J6HGT5_STRAD|nr:hypothetical protein CP975_00950 [Streptomyces alboniger]
MHTSPPPAVRAYRYEAVARPMKQGRKSFSPRDAWNRLCSSVRERTGPMAGQPLAYDVGLDDAAPVPYRRRVLCRR